MSFPNIPFPTMGGEVFWSTLKKRRGWKLQKNGVTGHYRVLDPNDIRRAWGVDYENVRHDFEIYTDADAELDY